MPKSKTETLANGRIKHFSVGAAIRRGDKFLLINRAIPPFGFAGIDGHINQDESDAVKALFRKVREVSGLKVERA
jgi:ADP-ribose pyrophosphatase YjhB (NUDIX family)